ncbi:unnamed protein product [Cylicostephanus goldi]|uniref:Galactose mutarotase n=1 Tax=Cylicostephanus goldi TaxID=71465 RepID=A0A3P6TTH5_CYLGO|nr:unnamed protein product [Cylicostephanus goldi]
MVLSRTREVTIVIALLGEIASVVGTKFDFTEEKPLHTLYDDEKNIDIDNDLILNTEKLPTRLLSLYSPVSGIRMQVSTSYPVLHIYGSKHLNCKGKNKEMYGSGKGLAIEPQFYTAALNYPHFPSIELTPEQPYLKEIIHSFVVESAPEEF